MAKLPKIKFTIKRFEYQIDHRTCNNKKLMDINRKITQLIADAEEKQAVMKSIIEALTASQSTIKELIDQNRKKIAKIKSTIEELEWQKFIEKISQDQIEILAAIATQENPQTTIKKIAERNITMPSLLIDDINEIANNTLGEIIIETNNEIPKISEEYLLNVQKMI